MNILAIKGGGARGIIVTRFLVEIEKITGLPTYKLFDYVGGSSVGALISCGLLVSDDGMLPVYTAQEVHDIFLKNLSAAFSWTYSSWLSSGFGLVGPSYTNIGLLKITEVLCGSRKVENLLKPIIFPAYDRKTHRAYYFEKEKDKELTLHNVIMSCTAAPTYFPSHPMEINDKKYDMIDGGVVVNNTAELAFLQATKHMNCIDKSKILELNIGTGTFPNTSSDRQGLLMWMPVIVETLMHASNENELFELSLSLPRDNYYIMDVPLDVKYYYTDDVRKETIDYYLKETEKWLEGNKEEVKNFCYKLMENKGFELPTDKLVSNLINQINRFDSTCELIDKMGEDDSISEARILTEEMIDGTGKEN